ncbi:MULTISPECIES: HlyD family secretion protein [unclassified Pseudomonas]|jgi:membrane fusion protein (multidrug efflux system)|uniref:HlyD family secretion protein n=1 Tax=unclassified Pseudomonas TaxID=196821 RepID=UPI000C880385|nr:MULTISPECIES: HlyD family secretion protein [unclassified Pseudomonas]PNA05593.1 hemolysin D [Pseudomonas sp. FW305-BF15]PNB80249.1 hemolysin D [Pseudomonas sp. FW305-BF6]
MNQPLDLTAEQARAHPVDAPPKMPLKQRLRPVFMWGVPALFAAIGYGQYVANEPFVSTDNAYARVAKASINARISGQVVEIAVDDNQPVRKGQVLFRIDPKPLQIAVDRAEAQLANARLRIDGLKASYRQQQAELQSAKASADYDQKEFGRKKALIATEFVSKALYERAETDLKVSRQRIASIEQQMASTVVALNGNPDIALDNHPTVREAKAQLDEAQLYLSYATVTAPDDGIVAKVDDLQVGNYVNNGAPAFALISDREIWVEANFRETQLTHMRPGQTATVTLDTYPDRPFKAHVISMSPGAGADFALLPPENATGNWVKVVQRVPVRLELDDTDPALPLFSGTSATVKVDTGHRSPWWHPLKSLLSAGNS